MDGSVYRVNLFRILFSKDLERAIKIGGGEKGKGTYINLKNYIYICMVVRKSGFGTLIYGTIHPIWRKVFLYEKYESKSFRFSFFQYIISCCQFSSQ